MNNYVMVGAGGTGTHLLTPLVMYLNSHHGVDGDWLLHVIDGDTVEIKNLERQMFKDTDVTLNKAEAAASHFNNGRVRAVPQYLNEENISRLIMDGDTVLICVDNFTVRKRIEDHCRTLQNVTVINGGNEMFSGSVQIWIRAKGENLTPALSFLHPEVNDLGPDRAAMTCAQAAALPGGEQTVISNLQSATWMLSALWRCHTLLHVHENGADPASKTWTELQYDLVAGYVEHIDQRMVTGWDKA